tara:strand:- start:75 stop:344 length:270 start_codon:yes stop_codon:yes gene_type:complete
MSDTVTHVFVSKTEVDVPDSSTEFIGKHEVTIDATYDGETKPFTSSVGTNSSFSDEDYGNFLFNSSYRGHIYASFGLVDPDAPKMKIEE